MAPDASGAVIAIVAVLDGLSYWTGDGRRWTPLLSVIQVTATFSNRWMCSLFSSRLSIGPGKVSLRPLFSAVSNNHFDNALCDLLFTAQRPTHAVRHDHDRNGVDTRVLLRSRRF
jgi:hypothetical protein